MKNNVVSFEPKMGINAQAHRRENNFLESFSVISYSGSEFSNPIELRVYGTKAKNYACLWVHGVFAGFSDYVSASGSGSAGGYGYHRVSAAAAEAIGKAGISLEKSISGVGDEAIKDALTSIADYLGIHTFTIHKAHA